MPIRASGRLSPGGPAPRLKFMTRRRIFTWLLVVLAIPAQAIAGYAQRLPCFDHAGGTAAVAVMDCHSAAADHGPGQPDCCGDSCPDMTACAAPHAASPLNGSLPVPETHSVPVDRYAVPSLTALSALPFRPPAFSHT